MAGPLFCRALTMNPWTRASQLSVAVIIALLAISAAAEQVLHRGGIGDPETLDPQRTGSATEGTITTDLFEGLLTFSDDGRIVNGTAKSWTVSDDGKKYRFTLHDGLLWSDGAPLDEYAYLYSMRRLMDPALASLLASFFYAIENAEAVNSGKMPADALGVTVPEPGVIEVVLREPAPYLPELIASAWEPAPRHAIEEFGSEWIRPGKHVSNGPFKLAEWIPGQYVKLVRNEYYFQAGKVLLDAVYHHPAEDIATSFRRFRAGELDVVTAFPTQQLDWVRENMPDALHVTPTINIEALVFNTSRAPFNDRRVRLALSMALSREQLVEKILKGGEQPAYAVIPPAATGYPDRVVADFAGLGLAERQQRARQLLAEAGFDEATPLEIELRINASDIRKRQSVAMAAMWKQIGVVTSILGSEDKARLRDIFSGNYGVAASLRITSSTDAYHYLRPYHTDAGMMNHMRYSSIEYDGFLDKVRQTSDAVERAVALRNAEQILLADHPIAPLYVYSSKKLVSPRVQGWIDNARSINPSRYLSLSR
jgi:oligopeptide transport system substrate-binding protein